MRNLLNILFAFFLCTATKSFAGGYYDRAKDLPKTQNTATSNSKYMGYKQKFSVYGSENNTLQQQTQQSQQALNANPNISYSAPNKNCNTNSYENDINNPNGIKPRSGKYEIYGAGINTYNRSLKLNQSNKTSEKNQSDNFNPLMPKQTKNNESEKTTKKPSEPFSLRKTFVNFVTGFDLSGYTTIAGGSGKYDFQLGNGWNVSSVSPSITGSQNSSFQTSSGLNQTYQNIADDQKLNSKLTFGSVAFALKLKMPSLFGINDEDFIRPFAFAEFSYNTIKPLKIEGTKEVSYSKNGSTTTFNNINSKYEYQGLRYGNIVGLGIHIYKGLYGMYGRDIFIPKTRLEAGYDFGNTIVFVAREELNYNGDTSIDPNTNISPKIKYESIMAGLRFKVM